jgi:hypothetical protein
MLTSSKESLSLCFWRVIHGPRYREHRARVRASPSKRGSGARDACGSRRLAWPYAVAVCIVPLLLASLCSKSYQREGWDDFPHQIPNAWCGRSIISLVFQHTDAAFLAFRMASAPSHPFWRTVIRHAQVHINESIGVEDLTGPIALYESVKTFLSFPAPFHVRLDVLDAPRIYPFSWARADSTLEVCVCAATRVTFDGQRCQAMMQQKWQDKWDSVSSVSYWSHTWH